MTQLLVQLRTALKQQADPKVRDSAQRFFKEPLKLYGLKNPVAVKICKTFLKELKPQGKAHVFNLCEQLWQSGYFEEALIACEWAYSFHQEFEKKDFKLFERWVKNYVTNWAECDTLCNHTIAAVVTLYPEYVAELKKWAASSNRWVRRAAAVTLIIPARQGLFKKEIFEIADLLLLDQDDLVQKGYGWMLKACAEFYEDEVLAYVLSHKAVMPRTALRYAIEKMPAAKKQQAMAK